MRVLLICDAGDGLLDLAIRAQAAGHKVRMFVRKFDRRTRPIGVGLVELVGEWRPHMDWTDLVVLEGNGVYMAEMESWRQRGVRIIGGDHRSAEWELDRKVGMAVFDKAGIAVPPYREFTDYREAIAFVERRGEVFYSKPCSDTADKSLSTKTGVPDDPAWQLRQWKKKHGRPPCPFLLQEPIEGVEFAVGAWFGPAGFAQDGVEENVEHKRLFAGDLGPNCGEAGTIMRYVRRSKLFDKVLRPLEDQLAGIDYVGNIDVNCIVDGEGHPWPLEFTMRLGWPAFNIEVALMAADPLEYLMAVAAGESTKGGHLTDQVAAGVVLAVPPYPNPPRDYDEIVGIPIYGVSGDHFHPCECQAGPEGAAYATAGGYIGVATGTGATVREAARGAYKVLGGVRMPGSPFWRNDIGRKLKRDLPRLQEAGFAAEMTY